MARTAPTGGAAPASAYVDHRAYVLSVLGRRCRWLDADDREAVFHDAYAVLLEKDRDGALDVAAMHPLQTRAFLARTAINKALDEGKRAWRKRSVALEEQDDGPAFVDEAQEPFEEIIAGATDRARLLEIITELPERQQTIIKLRFFFDREPVEIQRYLDLTERSYRREMERAMRHVAERFELVVKGSFCESRRSVILALVAGIAGPGRAEAARRHLATCPACASWAGELRSAVHRGAALIPMPVVLDARAATVRERIAELAGTLKQQIAGIVFRVDPATATAAGGARPGTVAATVAACVVACGGATYTAVTPVRDAVDGALGRKAQRDDEPARKAAATPRPAAATATPAPTVVPIATPAPTAPAAAAAAAQRATARRAARRAERRRAARRRAERGQRSARADAALPPPDPVAVGQEFGVESSPPPPAAPPPTASEFGP